MIYTALQKFENALEKWGFGQYWHESFLICDNFALIRDNTNYENIFYYINSLYIEKTFIQLCIIWASELSVYSNIDFELAINCWSYSIKVCWPKMGVFSSGD